MKTENNLEQAHLPDSVDDWLKDKTAPMPFISIEDKLLQAVNKWIKEHPGVEITEDYLLGYYARIACESPRTLSEHRDDDK